MADEHPRRRSTSPGSAAQLFGRHLIAVEVAGTLLLVALVGAVVIVAQEQDRCRAGARRPSRHG